MSSRNVLLNARERKKIASAIYRILLAAKTQFTSSSIEALKLFVESELNAISAFSIDYVEIATCANARIPQ